MHRASPHGIIVVPRDRSTRGRTGRRRTMPAQENKAIQDMDREELSAALPKLREEAANAEGRFRAARERLAETADVPTYVEVHEDHLVIDVRGTEKAIRMMSRLRIPLEHVQGAEADPEIEHTL